MAQFRIAYLSIEDYFSLSGNFCLVRKGTLITSTKGFFTDKNLAFCIFLLSDS